MAEENQSSPNEDETPKDHTADFDKAISTLTDLMTDKEVAVNHRLEAARSILHYTEPGRQDQ